jgi:hypothetical protein
MKLTKAQLTKRKKKRHILRPVRMMWRVYLKQLTRKEVIHV